jgi:hypothetical protein
MSAQDWDWDWDWEGLVQICRDPGQGDPPSTRDQVNGARGRRDVAIDINAKTAKTLVSRHRGMGNV